ncbi:MAG: NYN domain-containing protein, partial [Oscillospiraceae bacterium]
MSEEKRLAVLIDSDNVSAKYAQFIMNEVQKYGMPTYKRVYGDWEKGGNGWHNPAINYSIMPVQQCSYIAGKNATDFSMIIDAMDILYTGNVDGFVLVTSDSDFTRLAIRLREAGKLVVGIGELKTPRAFTISCHHFCYLNQIGEPEGTQDEASIRKAVINFVTENQGERIDLARIFAVLTSKFGNINFDELGYKRFSNFIDSFPELRRSNTFVSLRKKREEKPAPVVQKPEEVTVQAISDAMSEYLKEHEPEQDNMLKMESYLNSRFGKIDFAKFGSSRFARFIDKLPQFNRTGTLVTPAEAKPARELSAESYRREVLIYASDNMPDGGNIGQLNNHLMSIFGKDYFKALGFGDFKAALDSVGEVRTDGNRVYLAAGASQPEKPKGLPAPELSAVIARIQQYAAENMPDGGNIGQLNNELIGAYGKGYAAALGFGDFKALLAAVPDIRVSKNRAYSVMQEQAEESAEADVVIEEVPVEDTAAEVIAESVELAVGSEESGGKKEKSRRNRKRKPAAEDKPAENGVTEQSAEATAEEVTGEGAQEPGADEADAGDTADAHNAHDAANVANVAAEEFEKPEINTVKRDILQFVASAENGGSLSRLGGMLAAKYGRDFLKQLGFTSMRKLAAEITGTVVKNNKLYISDEFARQT